MRHPERLRDRSWVDRVEIVTGDAQDVAAVNEALTDIDVAYYLVHSMGAHGDYRQADIDAATAFGRAAKAAGVRRIIYLGGLGDPENVKSKHLVSRQEVGACLAAAGVPVA